MTFNRPDPMSDLYALIEKVELEEKYLFIVYEQEKVGIDVLDYETEDAIDGGWFGTIEEAMEFIREHEGSL